MAIVLLIVGLLLGGLVPTLSSQIDRQHIGDTRKQMEEIRQALIGFALSNGRLPCPADGTIATGQAGAGIEKATCPVGSNGGVLPWVTLGVSETDAWGRRFSYRVTPDFADAISANTLTSHCPAGTTATQSSFALCSDGNLDVLDKSGGNNIASNVPAVIVSHGTNGYGAYLPDGSQRPTTGASSDESENTDNNNTFVSHDPSPSFDDQVTWLSPNVLMNRMVTAGKLP